MNQRPAPVGVPPLAGLAGVARINSIPYTFNSYSAYCGWGNGAVWGDIGRAMELPMFLDVPDLPASLRRWDSHKLTQNGVYSIQGRALSNARPLARRLTHLVPTSLQTS